MNLNSNLNIKNKLWLGKKYNIYWTAKTIITEK